MNKYKLATTVIHAGAEPDASTGAIMTPIFQTSTFVQSAPGVNQGYEYARSQNPTRTALETAFAQLENAKYALAFSSGVAATDYTDTTDVVNVKNALTDKTKLVWLETPTNPLMNITDIEAVSKITKAAGILLCVDNTFASPYLQNPIDLGADIVMHSATKYLGGHSDVIQGCLMMNDDKIREQLYFIQKSCGAVPGPMDCFLVLRGIKTLAVRMRQHCENGRKIAHALREHPAVKNVYWCGFEDHPNYDIAKKQMRDFGGMMSFTTKVLSSTKLFSLAESLGGVESLINQPSTMTHASIPRKERIKIGLTDGLIRLSVGIEDADDLIEDLKQAIG